MNVAPENPRINMLASRMGAMRPSASMAAVAEVMRLKQEGHEILSLTIGEPDFAAPPHVIEVAIEGLQRGETGYRIDDPALRQAILDRFKANNGLEFDDGQIAIGSGVKQLIFAAFCATLDAGDEVIVPAPYWVSYPEIVQLFGGRSVMIPCGPEEGFKLSPESLAASLSPRTKWMVLNSPNNPSGAVYSKAEFAALGEVLSEYPSCLVLSDEIYEHFVFGGKRFASFLEANPEMGDRVLTANGVSKAYGMAGFRLGYAGGPGWLIRAIRNIVSQDTSCAGTISQIAAIAALTDDQSALIANRDDYQARRDRLVAGLNAIPGIECPMPDGAFYVFPSVAGLIGARMPDGSILADDSEVARYFVQTAHVASIAGSAFGLSPHLRMSFSTSEDVIDRACKSLAGAVARLRLQHREE